MNCCIFNFLYEFRQFFKSIFYSFDIVYLISLILLYFELRAQMSTKLTHFKFLHHFWRLKVCKQKRRRGDGADWQVDCRFRTDFWIFLVFRLTLWNGSWELGINGMINSWYRPKRRCSSARRRLSRRWPRSFGMTKVIVRRLFKRIGCQVRDDRHNIPFSLYHNLRQE